MSVFIKLQRIGWCMLLMGVVFVAMPDVAQAEPSSSQFYPDSFLESDHTRTTIARGVTHETFDQNANGEWLRADLVTVDLASGAKIEYLSTAAVTSTAPLSELAETKENVVSAMNGDFFDIYRTGAPVGAAIADGVIKTSANPEQSKVVGISRFGRGVVTDVSYDGTMTLPERKLKVSSFNTWSLPSQGVGVYTSEWGSRSRADVVGLAENVCEVSVRDGSISRVSRDISSGAIEQGSRLFVARDSSADLLCDTSVGDRVSYHDRVSTTNGTSLRTAVGGRQLLVADGQALTYEEDVKAPRSAVGFSRDGRTMYMMTIDGRQPDCPGLSLSQTARLMHDVGAYDALNLDGGGSATMLINESGSGLKLVNTPSDGAQRPISNGLAVIAR